MNQKQILMHEFKQRLEERNLKVFLQSLQIRGRDEVPFCVLKDKEIEISTVGSSWRNTFKAQLEIFTQNKKEQDEIIDLALEVLRTRPGLKAVRSIEYERPEIQEALMAIINIEFIYSCVSFSI